MLISPATYTSPVASAPSLRNKLRRFWPMLMVLCLGACASLPENVSRPISTALVDNSHTRIGKAVAERAAKAGTHNDSGFALVGSAELAFSSRMTLIEAAEKTLDLQYYAINADATTARMLEALQEAAQRGVRVRILLDDFNTAGTNAQVLKLAFVPNIEMRLFNPLPSGRASGLVRIISSLSNVARLQRRMHNKIFVADNAVAITGGRNIGENYFGQSKGTNFVDIDVLAAGRIARDLSQSFDQYWNNPLAYPVQSLMTAADLKAIEPKAQPNNNDINGEASSRNVENPVTLIKTVQDTPNPLISTEKSNVIPPTLSDKTNLSLLTWTWAPSVLMVDKPSKIAADADSVEASQDTTVDGLLQLMSQAKTDILIVSPYFVPGERMMQTFASIKARGVRVRVLTNSLASNDAPAAHVGYARYRKALLALGIELYEMRAEQPVSIKSFGSSRNGFTGSSSIGGSSRTSLHAKVVVIDDRLLVVGSMNLDLRSQLQNSEVALLIRNRAIANQATSLIEPAMMSGAYRVENVDQELVWRAPQGSGLQDSTTEPDASAGLKLLLKLLGPLAPEEML